MVNLKVKIGNIELKNPLMVASGTFGYGEEMNSVIDVNKFGAIVTKSVTYKKRDGNKPPRIAETECGMLNSIGLANVGIHSFIKEKIPFLQKLDLPIIVNIAGNTPQEYIDILTLLENESGIAGYEINLSCPNVKEGGLEFGRDANACFNITGALRKKTKRCLIIKLTPNSSFISEAGKAVEDAGADSISAINTLVGMAVDIQSRRPKISRITGGYSGPGIKPVALAKVFELYNAVKIPIIGIGGIMNWEDVIEFMLVGSVAVQLGTVNFVNPFAINEIPAKLNDYCIAKKIKNIHDLTGGILT
jgi:dihydroorotate dehydrogenase (NAD+) catalytic subunit